MFLCKHNNMPRGGYHYLNRQKKTVCQNNQQKGLFWQEFQNTDSVISAIVSFKEKSEV